MAPETRIHGGLQTTPRSTMVAGPSAASCWAPAPLAADWLKQWVAISVQGPPERPHDLLRRPIGVFILTPKT
jgi:hypothetical protein